MLMYQAMATHWSPGNHREAEAIQMTDDSALDEMLHVALDNAIDCEVSNKPERQLYWLRCAMLAQDELRRRS
jgi:hypothetical protein